MKSIRTLFALTLAAALVAPLGTPGSVAAQTTSPPEQDTRILDIIDAASADRIEADIRTLADFGTRNTFSDTISTTRGIGAARRWIFDEFERISAECGGCLEVFYDRAMVFAGGRVPTDTWVVNVVAVMRGTDHPNRYVIMSGDIDSRASNTMDYETDAPGANDNASGMAGTLEAARILTQYGPMSSSVAFVGLSGEEQGLHGGRGLARYAREQGWEITAVLNNDMIGNSQGIDGVVDNTTFRVFSEATPMPDYRPERWNYRTLGGEVDGPSRQIARYVHRIVDEYFLNLDAMMIYRLDRFGRGGHHTPFNNEGFPGVRIMETHENYIWQHQDIRTENGIAYGDVIENVDFDYAAKLTAVNAAVLASMAWAPPPPPTVRIAGAVQPSTTLGWDRVDSPNLAGYKVYWRLTTEPQWQWSRWVGDVDQYTLENIVIDNYLFGVAAVSHDGHESPVVFPTQQFRPGR